MFAGVLIAAVSLWAEVPASTEFRLDAVSAARIDRVESIINQRTDHFALEETLHIAVHLVRAAERHDLDPTLLLAIIEVESRYQRTGKSSVGARGLMQLMPSTARAFAKKAGVRWRGEKSLLEPDTNIEIGAAYFAHLLDRFDGDTELALAAYCHGPAAIRRSLKSKRGLSPRERRYGRRVLQVWRTLGEAPPSARERS